MKRNTIMSRLSRAFQTALLFIAVYIAILYFVQDSLVYHPGAYATDVIAFQGRALTRVVYETSSGKQTAFYLPPPQGKPLDRLWIMFGGNAGLVLSYANELPMQKLLQGDGFLLIDYPGYGYNQGKPSGQSIKQAADAAFAKLASRLGIDQQTLLARSGLVGHSLGTGVALEFAAAHPAISRIVLVAPFTSLYDMAFRQAGPAARLLHHNFDNAKILEELGKRDPPPQVIIFTGDQDQIIPISMSRELAHDNPWLIYHELPGYEHNYIVERAAPQIALYMAAMK